MPLPEAYFTLDFNSDNGHGEIADPSLVEVDNEDAAYPAPRGWESV